MDEVTDHYLQNLKQEYDVDIHEDHGSHHEEAEGDDHSRDEITQHIGREGITQEIGSEVIGQHIGRELYLKNYKMERTIQIQVIKNSTINLIRAFNAIQFISWSL